MCSNSLVPTNLEPPVSRRDFLFKQAPAALAALGLLLTGDNRNRLPTESKNHLGFGIYTNDEGTPIYYQPSNGPPRLFDQDLFLRIRQEVLASNHPSPQILFATLIDPPHQPPPEIPNTREKPAVMNNRPDTVSTSELARRHIQIIQGTDTELLIRQGAFNQGEMLASHTRGTDNNLIIAVVDGPVSSFTTQDSCYDQVRPLFASQPYPDLATYKSESIHSLKERLKSNSQDISAQTNLYLLEHVFTDSDLKKRIGEVYGSVGKYFSPQDVAEYTSLSPNTSVIFFSTRWISSPSFVNLYIDAQGKFCVGRTFGSTTTSCSLLPNQTHPNPNEISLKGDINQMPTKDYYPLTTKDRAGLTLTHELEHNILNNLSSSPPPTFQEWSADRATYYRLVRAYNRWHDSGFTDDSLYYFDLHTQGQPHILT